MTSNKLLKWKIPDKFDELPEVVFRNDFALKLSKNAPSEICSSYVYMSFEEMEELYSIGLHYLGSNLSGSGIELGAGCALLSSAVIKNSPAVEKIYAVEIVSGFPKLIQPIISSAYIKDDAYKLMRTIGSFDNIECFDESLDFAIEIDSLHHSHNLEETLREVSRVLKPGGIIFAFDRSHPDTVTDEKIEKMLNHIYTPEFIKANNYPKGTILTRRDNGEHEIRISEWIHAFEKNHLGLHKVVFIHRKPNLKSLIKSVIRIFFPKRLFQLMSKSNLTKKRGISGLKEVINGLIWFSYSFFSIKHIMHSKMNCTLFICKKR